MNSPRRIACAACVGGLSIGSFGSIALAHAGPCTVTPSPNWSDSISFPSEPLAVPGVAGTLPAWVKFTILTCDPQTVYFQDSVLYPFHHDFATNELDPFLGLSPGAYDQVTLFATGQEAILGAVLLPGWSVESPPPGGFPQEYGIQLVRQDAYTAQEVVDLFGAVVAAVNAPPGVQPLYFPTFEQAATAEANSAFLAANGVTISSADRWSVRNPIYSDGWTLGPLTWVPGDQIQAAYIAGTLEPGDVLLTDAVPAEVPFVAGIIALEPSTPNSHVAILASTFDIPFVQLALEADAQAALDMVGDRVILRAVTDGGGGAVTLVNIEGVLDEATIQALLDLKAPPVLDIVPKSAFGALSAPVSTLDLADIRYFGGKAVNYSLLLDAIPANTRIATAFSFDLWDEYLDQMLPWGITLREEIDLRLSAYTWPPTDFGAVVADLDAIRDLFKDEASTAFTGARELEIISVLRDPQYGFDDLAKIRFRSSTNVEDGDQFTGAGLYDSKSGCLADDLDADAIGPSLCEPEEPDEKGVFRALRRVFASFYNDNAFFERLRHGVNETDVGMAVLVHHSFPDPIELANGVATYEETLPLQHEVHMVTQPGANSVANPEGGAVPEEVRLASAFTPWSAEVTRYSSLVVLGQTVMNFTAEYVQFAELFELVAAAWEQATGVSSGYLLDFEYKKILPGDQLVVKQVRQVPQPSDLPSMTPFLVNQPIEYEVFQGEYGTVFANHRLKSRLALQTRNIWMTNANLQQSIYTAADFDFTDECVRRGIDDSFTSFPGHAHALTGFETTDTWQVADLANPRTYVLRTQNVLSLVPPSQPLIVQADIDNGRRYLDVTYQHPVFTIDFDGPTLTTFESALLVPRTIPHPDDQLQARTLEQDGVTITTRFFWPPPPEGFTAGYTAPSKRFLDTTITGLTTDPITLTDYYAQTYRPEHHNFGENFAFDPWLDPDVTHAQLEELETQDIRLIVLDGTLFGTTTMLLYGNIALGMTCPPHCNADTDRSGAIDVDDIVNMVLAWGTDDAAADATSDGVVDVDDIVEAVLTFGPCL